MSNKLSCDDSFSDESKQHSNTKSGTVHFQIHGSGITRFARQQVLEGRWIDAQNMLLSGLPGITYEMVVSILTGENRLHGVNEVELLPEEPDTKEEFTENLTWFTAGVFYDRSSNTYWRPYAVVTSWNRDDLRSGSLLNSRWHSKPRLELRNVGGGAHAKDKEFRSVFYMDDSKNDRAREMEYEVLGCHSVVLWEEVSAIIPAWMPKHKTWQDALDEYVKVRGELDVRGGTKRYTDSASQKAGPYEPPLRKQEEPEPSIEEILGPPPVEGDYTSDLGWLLPDGRFFPCAYTDHRITARKIWYYLFDKQTPADEEGTADKAGWVKLYRWEGLHAHIEGRLTDVQSDFLKLWAKHHNVKPMYEDDDANFTAY